VKKNCWWKLFEFIIIIVVFCVLLYFSLFTYKEVGKKRLIFSSQYILFLCEYLFSIINSKERQKTTISQCSSTLEWVSPFPINDSQLFFFNKNDDDDMKIPFILLFHFNNAGNELLLLLLLLLHWVKWWCLGS
jgi:hypothetical protein